MWNFSVALTVFRISSLSALLSSSKERLHSVLSAYRRTSWLSTRSDARMVETLLAFPSAWGGGALLDMPGRDGWTPLGFAARTGQVGIARALLGAGARAL